jgi:MFS family permease
MTQAASLLWTSRKMQLLSTLNVSFGLTQAFITQWVNGTLTKNAVVRRVRVSARHCTCALRSRVKPQASERRCAQGDHNVGYMAAVGPLVAALLCPPFSWLANRVGKLPVMVFGGLNFAMMCDTSGRCWAGASPVTRLLPQGYQRCRGRRGAAGGDGLGSRLRVRAVRCGPRRVRGHQQGLLPGTRGNSLGILVPMCVLVQAVFADFFPDRKEAAFANVVMQSGGSAAVRGYLSP